MADKVQEKKSSDKPVGKAAKRVKRAPSVPDGRHPVLIVEPERKKTDRQGTKSIPRPDTRRRDPLLEPEVVTARVRTETIKDIGSQLFTLANTLDQLLREAQEEVQDLAGCAPTSHLAAQAEKVGEVLEKMVGPQRDFRYLAGKATVGMAVVQLAPLIRDAVKRAYHGHTGARFRLPEMTCDFPVTVHPQHMLDAITLAVSIVLDRINGCGELRISLDQGKYFAQIKIIGQLEKGMTLGGLPRAEGPARLRHLVVGLHQGALSSETGDNGEVVITIALPLRSFEAEVR